MSKKPSSKTLSNQRLLYLHARTPNVFSPLIGLTQIEPTSGYQAEITADPPKWPYQSVHEAMIDGWQVIQFPHLQAPFDDHDLEFVGYEFILQKIEPVK